MTFRMVLVAMVAAAMVAAAHAHSASETTSSPGDPLHWNSITRSWECTSLNPCADQPDLAEAKDEKVLWEAKTNEASTKTTTKTTILAAQAENEKALKAVQHAEAAVGRHKAKGMKNPAGAGIMLLQAQAGWGGSDNLFQTNAGTGGWGGSCTCPDGSVYQVGDNGDACGSLACGGGTSGQCNRHHGEWSGNKVSCAAVAADDPLHFNPAQSDPASPLSNETSICRGWYISDGPVNHGSNKAAADALNSAADGTWTKGTTKRMGSPPTTTGITTDGTGWAVGFKHGCTEVKNGNNLYTICGCYEIWCPVRTHTLSHPDDIYGRDASGVDGSMAVRNTCYSARAVLGCYMNGNWVDDCGWQTNGSYQPGAGNDDGQFVRSWEQLVM